MMHLLPFVHHILPIKQYLLHHMQNFHPVGIYITSLVTKNTHSEDLVVNSELEDAIKDAAQAEFLHSILSSSDKPNELGANELQARLDTCLNNAKNKVISAVQHHLALRPPEYPTYQESDFNNIQITTDDLKIDHVKMARIIIQKFIDELASKYPNCKDINNIRNKLNLKPINISQLKSIINAMSNLKLSPLDKNTLHKICEVIATILTLGGYWLFKYGIFNNYNDACSPVINSINCLLKE